MALNTKTNPLAKEDYIVLDCWRYKDFIKQRSVHSKAHSKTGHPSNDIGHFARSFSKLMFQGKIHFDLQLLEKGGEGGILYPDDKVTG